MRIIALCFTALLSLAALAQGVPGPGQPGPGPQIDSCNATYNGSYQYSGGPLWITLERLDWNGNINVTLDYRGQLYYGQGRCDGRGVSFRVRGGWPHEAQFAWAYGRPQMRGTQWVRGRPYQGFYLEYRGY